MPSMFLKSLGLGLKLHTQLTICANMGPWSTFSLGFILLPLLPICRRSSLKISSSSIFCMIIRHWIEKAYYIWTLFSHCYLSCGKTSESSPNPLLIVFVNMLINSISAIQLVYINSPNGTLQPMDKRLFPND